MTGTAFRVLPLLLLAAVLCCSASAQSKDAGKSFAELGLISWHHDQEAALAKAKKTGKPLTILTTELPGWVITLRRWRRKPDWWEVTARAGFRATRET